MTKSLNTTSINNSNFQSALWKAGYNLFSKPTTYMNNSGIAVKNIMDYYKVDLENIKYCTMTIIHNNPSIFENLFKLLTKDYERNISSSDSIVLEIGGELFDLNNSNCLDETKSLENKFVFF